ncbi:MAG: M56 family metallopeptidase, partial [Chitinophagaceae bacterium]
KLNSEVQAVLLHELAHIRRHDYLVNYLQRVAETLLFFNPGLLWVSSLLRAEREACCDEIAIEQTGNKRQFVEALIRCKENALSSPAFSLGLFGNRNQLLQRLNRIVLNRNKSLSPFEASFFGVSILILSLVLSGWNDRTNWSKTPASLVATNQPVREIVVQISEQEAKKKNKQIAVNVKPAHLELVNKRATQPKKKPTREIISEINAKKQIPEIIHEPLLETTVQLNERTTKRKIRKIEAEQRRVMVDWNRIQLEKAHQMQINRTKAERYREQAEREREFANQYRQQAEKDRLHADRDRIEIQKLRQENSRQRQRMIVQ